MLDWNKYIKVAKRFQYKVRFEDREDIQQSIILELAKAVNKYDSCGKTFGDGGLYRVASFVVADYWRKELRKPPLISLNKEVEDGDGDMIQLYQLLGDDKAINVDDWLNAKLWLYRCPERLVSIAYKKVAGYPLRNNDYNYLNRQRKKFQKSMVLA